MRFDRRWIEAHIPHQGRMCLLDEVRAWDQSSLECASRTHRAPDHPLRAHGRLGAACLLEYAAQAMAVHGALRFPADTATATRSIGAGGSIGVLASARSVELRVADLDDIAEELLIHVERQHSDERGALYEFRISAAGTLLAQGRAAVLFGAAPSPPT
jgi:predicted hotdog family 3-hydroxylacyl-ACP dehydratase